MTKKELANLWAENYEEQFFLYMDRKITHTQFQTRTNPELFKQFHG